MAKQSSEIKRIVKFETHDGKIHESWSAAQRHQSEQNFIVWCEDNLPQTGNLTLIAQTIRQHWNVSKKKPKVQDADI